MNQSVSNIIKRVRRLEIVSNRFANDLFSGGYKSVFRGRGIEFSEVREYEPGDDVRQIDWNVTARAGRPYIKRFVEERELTVLFVVDVSASGLFGSSRSRLDCAVEIVATLMFSALKNNDKVGLLTFADQVIQYIPPKKGKGHVLHLIRELVAGESVAAATNLNVPLDYLNRVLNRRAVVFYLSDFLGPDFDRSLSVCSHKHDLIAVTLSDQRESDIPNVGFLRLFDPETGRIVEADTGSARVRHYIVDRLKAMHDRISFQLRKAKVDAIQIDTQQDFLLELRRFFRARQRRFR